MSAPALLAELERARTFGVNPSASALWIVAPPELRRQFADGYISAETFWAALARWLRGTS